MRRNIQGMLAVGVVISAGVVFGDAALGQSRPTRNTIAASELRAPSEPRIVLVRGLMEVFSTGLDDLSGRLQASGYSDVTVSSWSASSTIVQQLMSAYRKGETSPIILIGHSLGANASIEISRQLGQANIPVSLLVTFDATEPLSIPSNVSNYVNFYQQNGVGRAPVRPHDFRGEFASFDLTGTPQITHTNIEKSGRLHLFVIEKIAQLSERETQGAVAGRKRLSRS